LYRAHLRLADDETLLGETGWAIHVFPRVYNGVESELWRELCHIFWWSKNQIPIFIWWWTPALWLRNHQLIGGKHPIIYRVSTTLSTDTGFSSSFASQKRHRRSTSGPCPMFPHRICTTEASFSDSKFYLCQFINHECHRFDMMWLLFCAKKCLVKMNLFIYIL